MIAWRFAPHNHADQVDIGRQSLRLFRPRGLSAAPLGEYESRMKNLEKARAALAHYESRFGLQESIRYLTEGLDLLDEIIEARTEQSDIARNVGVTYFSKLLENISMKLESGIETEPNLEILYRTILEFEGYSFCNNNELSRVKLDTFNQLFNRYYQGYSKEEKQKAIRDLLGKIST